jgi:hypothetical protein
MIRVPRNRSYDTAPDRRDLVVLYDIGIPGLDPVRQRWLGASDSHHQHVDVTRPRRTTRQVLAGLVARVRASRSGSGGAEGGA